MLFDICRAIGEAETAHVLEDSWGGNVARGMQEHYKARQAERRVRAVDVINAKARHKEKERLK